VTKATSWRAREVTVARALIVTGLVAPEIAHLHGAALDPDERPVALVLVSQIVPRTVAEANLPDVRNLPLPLPHSLPSTALGPFFLSTLRTEHKAREAWPLSTTSVVSAPGAFGTDCLIWKIPS
jgi:hypothetical protein